MGTSKYACLRRGTRLIASGSNVEKCRSRSDAVMCVARLPINKLLVPMLLPVENRIDRRIPAVTEGEGPYIRKLWTQMGFW